MSKKEKSKSKSIRVDYDAPAVKKKKKKKAAELPSDEAPKKKKKKKRSVDVETADDVPKKKKKKKKKLSSSTELVVAEEPKKKDSVSSAKKKQQRLQEQIESDLAKIEILPAASSQEREQLDEYLHMFRKLAKLIRKAEKQCMKSGQSRDYYALCTLMSQQREVIADIRSVSDMSGQVQALESNMIQPMIRSIGQMTVDVFYQIRKLIVATSRPEETQFALSKLNDITTEQGKHLHAQYGVAVEKVHQILLG